VGVFVLRRKLDHVAATATRLRRRAGLVCAPACALLLAFCVAAPARADVGVVLNESLDTSVARITGSGHSAVYFSRICPETPIKVRLCRPGEEGSVISNYTTLGEDQPFEWNAVPLSIYLYGVEDPANRPLFGTEKFKRALEERYREKYLAGLCESKTCRTSNSAEWREMVAATMERSLYIFVVKTTVEQDEALIAELNSQPNVNHFNGVKRNCATFTQRWINAYFPHATSANYLNDFGMTSPKAIARSFTRYAGSHPETELRVLHFAQLPGTYKRSSVCREGTEQLYRSKKLLVPMVLFADHELPFVAASYVETGGAVWLNFQSADGNSRVGVSASNVFSPASDANIAYEILLARAIRIAQSPKHSRETMVEFQVDWAALATARARLYGRGTATAKVSFPARRAISAGPGSD
jgi:hypothetical protein